MVNKLKACNYLSNGGHKNYFRGEASKNTEGNLEGGEQSQHQRFQLLFFQNIVIPNVKITNYNSL